jgi:hypothetical protein
LAQPKSKHVDDWVEPARKIPPAQIGLSAFHRPLPHRPPFAIERKALPPTRLPLRAIGKTALPASIVVLVAPVVAAVVGVVPKWFAIPAIIGLAAVGLAAVASWALDNDTPW